MLRKPWSSGRKERVDPFSSSHSLPSLLVALLSTPTTPVSKEPHQLSTSSLSNPPLFKRTRSGCFISPAIQPTKLPSRAHLPPSLHPPLDHAHKLFGTSTSTASVSGSSRDIYSSGESLGLRLQRGRAQGGKRVELTRALLPSGCFRAIRGFGRL